MYAIVYGLLEELPQIIPVPASEPPHLENRSPLSLIPPRISTAPYGAPQGALNPGPGVLGGFWNQPPDLQRHPPALFTPEPLYPPFDATTPAPSALAYWSQPPDLLRHPEQLDTNQLTMPFDALEPSATPTVEWWEQPPDLLRHATHLDTNQLTLPNALSPRATSTAWWWTQPPNLLRHTPELFANQTFFAPLPGALNPTPDSFGFWTEPLDLQKHPAHLDTNLPQMTFAWQQFPTPTALAFWAEPPDLQWHPQQLDTNQAQDPWVIGRTGVPTPNIFWWSQPPDLQRLMGIPDTNQSRLVSQQFATPTALAFWVEPPDLQRHPTHLDTNESRLVAQQFAEPGTWWWTQPPNLLRHVPEMWANEPYLAPIGGAIGLAPTSFGFWIQAVDLFRHPPELWVDQPRVPPQPTFANQTPEPLGWWIQSTPLPWSARFLDTQQGARTWEGGETPFEPAIWWWDQPPDLLRHPTALDTNQWTLPGASLQVSFQQFWSQPPDLIRHPPHLDTNQWTLPDASFLISSRQWWMQPPDLLHHAPHLDTNESRLVAQALAEPALWWWVQPLDLFRHATHLDTNQPVVSFRDLDTPVAFGFFRQPPDTPRRAPELAPAAPYIGPLPATGTPTGFGFWMQPQFQRPRAPDLWTAQVYESRGVDFATSPLILPPAGFIRPVAPNLSGSILLPGRDFPITPKQLAFYFHSDLLRHPPELFTWQTYVGPNRIFDTPNRATYFGQPQDLLRKPPGDIVQPWTHIVGWRYAFIASAFVITRSKLKIISTAKRPALVASPSRIRILTGTKNRQRLPDLQPPIIAGAEREYVTFDFGKILNDGVSITSIVAVNCFTDEGPDTTPMSRILNTPSVIPSLATGVPAGAVIALFGSMVAANTYVIECVVTVADGQELALEARWSCVSAP